MYFAIASETATGFNVPGVQTQFAATNSNLVDCMTGRSAGCGPNARVLATAVVALNGDPLRLNLRRCCELPYRPERNRRMRRRATPYSELECEL